MIAGQKAAGGSVSPFSQLSTVASETVISSAA